MVETLLRDGWCFCTDTDSSILRDAKSIRIDHNGILGGGFKYFLFSPLPGEMIQFDKYFSYGLVQPPTGIF